MLLLPSSHSKLPMLFCAVARAVFCGYMCPCCTSKSLPHTSTLLPPLLKCMLSLLMRLRDWRTHFPSNIPYLHLYVGYANCLEVCGAGTCLSKISVLRTHVGDVGIFSLGSTDRNHEAAHNIVIALKIHRSDHICELEIPRVWKSESIKITA